MCHFIMVVNRYEIYYYVATFPQMAHGESSCNIGYVKYKSYV